MANANLMFCAHVWCDHMHTHLLYIYITSCYISTISLNRSMLFLFSLPQGWLNHLPEGRFHRVAHKRYNLSKCI